MESLLVGVSSPSAIEHAPSEKTAVTARARAISFLVVPFMKTKIPLLFEVVNY
jgi:hypothetical protein